ncbi:hypothetical protein HGRIS_004849 [Hohenbuehelia grisea]|uniref:DNA polymerase n=1 Tax=Hohenbuehelia grisea TaxID=104357 RepID=A0ABR3JD59_9AGAR
MSDRARRERKSKLDKLAEYKRVRQGGGRVLDDDTPTTLYDEVSEEQYKGIVKGRLQKDDFVVDDGVEGYMDNGMDDWTGADDEEVMESDMEEDSGKRKKKSRKTEDSKPKAKPKPRPMPAPAISAYRPTKTAEEEEDLMSSLLSGMDAQASTILPSKSRKRKPSPAYRSADFSSSPVRPDDQANGHFNEYDGSSDVYDDSALPPASDDLYSSPKKRAKTSEGALTPAAERLADLNVQSGSEDSEFADLDMDSFMEIDEADLVDIKPLVKKEHKEPDVAPKQSTAKALKADDAPPAWLSVYDSLSVSTPETLGPVNTSGKAITTSKISAQEPDGSLRFYWLDYIEYQGRVFFLGKVKDKASDAWVSCCVTVENIQRNLFVVPREKRVEQDEDDPEKLIETDVVPELKDVYDDFDMIRKSLGIKSWKGKFVKRNYVFGEEDVPRGESQFLKVVYGYNEKEIPNTAESPNIARIFGTSTSAFELLVLKRKIMGPCWLQIKKPEVDNKGVSWCKLEVTVSDPKDINPFPESDPDAPKDIPPLTVMSLSVRTIVNHKENNREIVCATARIWNSMHIEDRTPPERQPCAVHTFVRPLDRFPSNFEARARAGGKGVISPAKNERMLLNSLLVTLYKADPDVIVGHDFLGVSLDVLLNRMRTLKADHWSRIGRFRRNNWPNIGRQGTNLKFLTGRLLCDLSGDGAKGMIASTTWSLTELCKTFLKSDRQEIDPDDTASYFDGNLSNPERLLTFVRHCELDAHYQMAIASEVQIMPLTKQLTNLAGNSWNKTLNGGRAERNEYILLHEFHRLKYICPDKWGNKKAAAAAPVVEPQDGDEAEGGTASKGKKKKYQGGLVFEPQRRLWDKFILVMDFNSLYPSIIQEYNIDFTTVERVDPDENGEERIPEPPSSDVPQGVLPRLIATLVNRRRQVKSLMKDKAVLRDDAKLRQYDIKQLALKLTANSMYGCLGFEHSRFYARPLAALTTHKGREILTDTRQLAESLGLAVVYGDTDSVFVNSNETDFAKAKKISEDFKKAVNERYKLLEIDLDGVFQRMLLLHKKKYAALKVEKVEDGKMTVKVEVKGLDMKRREYCVLSKNVSEYVLNQILSGESPDTVVDNIHEYLRTLAESVREGKYPIDDFIIFKRLSKNPEEYGEAKGLPHVQVAVRMKAKGGSARSGDVIPYIFCLSEGEESTKTPQADRARHPNDVRRADSKLRIDFDYYLVHQILPPIARLCEYIQGTDRARLAESLGLDPGRYNTIVNTEASGEAFASLDSQISDKDRFKDAAPFLVRCRKCQGQLTYEPMYERDVSVLRASGPECPGCQAPFSVGSLQMQLEAQIREHIGVYYEGWTICDDATCGNRTRAMGVYGRRCLKRGCPGTVAFEYSDAQLYNQLRYYAFLFDAEKAVKAAPAHSSIEEIRILGAKNADFLEMMAGTVIKYLDHCGRRWVDLSNIFSFMSM